MPLSHHAVRVLGALLEKAHTTPDAYPLSMQALTAACNQKTARDPVTTLSEREVEQALQQLRDRGLADTVRRSGDRVPKHRHRLTDALGLSAPDEAIVSILLLRGPQTAGELRTRSERYGGIHDVATVEKVLVALAERRPPLVANHGRRPGQSQDRWESTLGPSAEERKPRARAAEGSQPRSPDRPPSDLLRRIENLEERVAALEAKEG